MIVVTERIPVAQGHEIDFEQRFATRRQLAGPNRLEIHEVFLSTDSNDAR